MFESYCDICKRNGISSRRIRNQDIDILEKVGVQFGINISTQNELPKWMCLECEKKIAECSQLQSDAMEQMIQMQLEKKKLETRILEINKNLSAYLPEDLTTNRKIKEENEIIEIDESSEESNDESSEKQNFDYSSDEEDAAHQCDVEINKNENNFSYQNSSEDIDEEIDRETNKCPRLSSAENYNIVNEVDTHQGIYESIIENQMTSSADNLLEESRPQKRLPSISYASTCMKIGSQFVCTLCSESKKYNSIVALRYHIKTIHYGIRYVCADCGKKYTSLSYFQEHYRNVHNMTAIDANNSLKKKRKDREKRRREKIAYNISYSNSELDVTDKKMQNTYTCEDNILKQGCAFDATSLARTSQQQQHYCEPEDLTSQDSIIPYENIKPEISNDIADKTYKHIEQMQNPSYEEITDGLTFATTSLGRTDDKEHQYCEQQQEITSHDNIIKNEATDYMEIKPEISDEIISDIYPVGFLEINEENPSGNDTNEHIINTQNYTHEAVQSASNENLEQNRRYSAKTDYTYNIETLSKPHKSISSTVPISFTNSFKKVGDHYVCILCTELKKFNSSTAVRYHIKAMHYGLRYICSECGKKYTSSFYMQEHYRTVHNLDTFSFDTTSNVNNSIISPERPASIYDSSAYIENELPTNSLIEEKNYKHLTNQTDKIECKIKEEKAEEHKICNEVETYETKFADYLVQRELA